jgi:translocation and assembly module TamB
MWEQWRTGWRKWIVLGGGGAFSLLLILVAALEAGLLNGPVLWLAGRVSGYEISCSRLNGSLFSSFSCENLAVADQQGTFFVAKESALAWNIAALLANQVSIQSLTLRDAKLTRIPKGGSSRSQGILPSTRITLSHLDIAHLVLAAFKTPAACVGIVGTADIGPAGFSTDLKLARCHPRKGEFFLHSRYVKSTENLSLQATAHDDGLLLSQLLGLRRVGVTQLSLDLAGTLPALNGTLKLRADKIGHVAATFQAKTPDQTKIDGDFGLAPDRVPGFASTSSGKVSATVSYRAQRGVLVHLATLSWGGFTATGELGASAKGKLYGNIALRSSVAHSLAGLRIGDLEVGLMLAGSEAAPRVHGRATLKNIAAANALITQLKAEFDADRHADGGLLLQLAGAATAARLPPQLFGLLGDHFSFGAHLQRPAHGQVQLQASLNGHAAEAKLTAALGQTRGSGILRLRVPDLFKANAGFGGSVAATLKLTSLTLAGRLEGAFDVTGRAISAKGLGLALGHSPSLTGRIAVHGKSYTLSNLRLHLAALSASGALSVSRAGVLLGHVAVAHGELAPFASVLGSRVAGSFALEARASGSLQAPVMALDISVPKLLMAGNLLREVRLGLHATLAQSAQASLHITAATAIGPVAFASTLAVHRQGWALAVSQGAIGPAKLVGTLARDHGVYSGRLRLTGDLLAPAGLLLGQPATGAGTILVQGRGNELQLRARLDHITVSPLRQASLIAMANLHDLAGPVDLTAQLRQGANDLQARAQARLTPFVLRLTELHGQWSAIHFGLRAPTSLQLGHGQFQLARTSVAISGGVLELAAQGAANQLLAEAQLTSLPLSPFATILRLHHASGTLDGALKVALTQTSTAAHLVLHGRDIVLSSAAKAAEPAALAFEADWNGRALTAAGRISGFSPAPATISLELPLIRPASSFAPHLAGSGAISGQLLLKNLDVGHLSALLPLAEESAKGLVTADVNLDGDMAHPRIHGSLVITKGSFSDLRTGTRLTNLDAKLVADHGDQVDVQVSANDGGSGTIKLNGKISRLVALPATPGHIAGELTVALNDAELIREDLIHGALSGTLKVNLPASGPVLISGKLRSDTVRIDLGAAIPPSIPTIEVRYAGQQASPVTRPGPRPASASAPELFSAARLNIAVDIPNRLYIAGRGLNSEWDGHLDVAGTIGRPAFRGRLQVMNGSADVIGKSFTLQSGVVHISNALPGNANVNVTAQHTSTTLTVTLTITGPANDPKIDWSSVPALPKSEILSNLLFGSGTPQLSLGQAFQLAQMSGALSSLGLGGGGGGGLLGFARNLTGLDVLNVTGPDTAQGTGASVTAGKYIGGKIYVGVTQGASTSASSAEVRITVAPHVTVTGTVGANNANSLGVDWLWRY